MTMHKKAAAIAAGLAIAASLFAYAPDASATTCTNFSTSWTQSITCPGTTNYFGKAWGDTVKKIGGIPFRIKTVYAMFFGSRGGTATGAALDSTGHVISGCIANDYGPADLYPTGNSSAACQSGATIYLLTSY